VYCCNAQLFIVNSFYQVHPEREYFSFVNGERLFKLFSDCDKDAGFGNVVLVIEGDIFDKKFLN
jgi:uncharacterized protein YbcI